MNAALLLVALAFAFPNAQGTRLLATGEIAKPEPLRIAICSGGQQLSVQFERRQPEGPKTTGRQTPQNFAQTGGAVFRIVSGNVSPDATCVLGDESLLAAATVVPLKRPPQTVRCSKATYPLVQADKNRPVVGCWPIAESPAGIQVAIIEFS